MLDAMAQHRRVEARIGIIGTGMASDVERLRDVEADQERKERAWRAAPEKGFGEVLTEAPAKGELENETPDDPRKRKKAPTLPEGASSSSSSSETANAAVAGERSAAVLDQRALPAKLALPKVAPDPRERMLREKLASSLRSPKVQAPVDTPPTGSHLRKP